jgi:hypothetical protein
MSVAASAVFPKSFVFRLGCFSICACGRRVVTYKYAEGDDAPDGFCPRRLHEGWIRNVVGEENPACGVAKCGTRGAASASQYGIAYE